MANSSPLLRARRECAAPTLAEKNPASLGDNGSGGDEGTRLPPSASVEVPPIRLSLTCSTACHQAVRHTSSCHIADCVQADQLVYPQERIAHGAAALSHGEPLLPQDGNRVKMAAREESPASYQRRQRHPVAAG